MIFRLHHDDQLIRLQGPIGLPYKWGSDQRLEYRALRRELVSHALGRTTKIWKRGRRIRQRRRSDESGIRRVAPIAAARPSEIA